MCLHRIVRINAPLIRDRVETDFPPQSSSNDNSQPFSLTTRSRSMMNLPVFAPTRAAATHQLFSRSRGPRAHASSWVV